jgi:ribosomal protein L20A (L18A)
VTLRIHGTHKTTDVQMRPRKNEAPQRFMTRVYNELGRRQRELFSHIKIEVIETSTGVLIDTCYGLI